MYNSFYVYDGICPVCNAHMHVVDKGAHVEYTRRTVDVNASSPIYDTAPLHVVGYVIQYDCSNSRQSYLMIIRNALFVPEMTYHIIPRFIMR